MKCPVGLICEYFDECDRAYCNSLVRPWPLPYCIDSDGQSECEVELPAYNHTINNVEDLEYWERYNEWVQSIRNEYWLGGWWDAVLLPYQSHPAGGLLVIKPLRLNNDIDFACHSDFANGFSKYIDYWEAFEPAVPIHGYQKIFERLPPTPPPEALLVDKYCIERHRNIRDYIMLYFSDFIGWESNNFLEWD
ncbi:hypothetical protein [Anabaena azotica]|uniref:Uncharacterized protein n=1 Tax=Anabaena azotica FACHB-119 TaxID=947527 RepID=A0ABR8D9W9_9NOST|nr:hypothetical protein [Anabaena azotica]MBD2503434.1 hypothetical protein [Anabaena azotica FACHB-119]